MCLGCSVLIAIVFAMSLLLCFCLLCGALACEAVVPQSSWCCCSLHAFACWRLPFPACCSMRQGERFAGIVMLLGPHLFHVSGAVVFPGMFAAWFMSWACVLIIALAFFHS